VAVAAKVVKQPSAKTKREEKSMDPRLHKNLAKVVFFLPKKAIKVFVFKWFWLTPHYVR
jgi:hypothetical protein